MYSACGHLINTPGSRWEKEVWILSFITLTGLRGGLSVFVYMFVQYRRHKVNEGRIRDKIRSFISIAHDIRTPVTLIKAPLSELEAQEGLPEQG